MRPAVGPVLGLTDGWVRSFRKRWHLSRIRRATTDRVDNPDLLRADNAWRQEYEEVVQFPALFNAVVDALWRSFIFFGVTVRELHFLTLSEQVSMDTAHFTEA